MYRILILLLLCGIKSMQLLRAQTMSSVFVSMPQEFTVYLDGGLKHDLLALWDDKRQAVVTNLMNGRSTLNDFSDDYFFLQATESSSFEACLLPVNDSTKIVCLISTVYSPTADSRLAFYTTKWQKLNIEDYITLPQLDDFLKQHITLPEGKQVADYFDALFVHYSFDRQQGLLKARLTSLDYMIENKQVDEMIAQKELYFRWDGKYHREVKTVNDDPDKK